MMDQRPGPIAAIEKAIDLAASPERVWAALTDPEELAAWTMVASTIYNLDGTRTRE